MCTHFEKKAMKKIKELKKMYEKLMEKINLGILIYIDPISNGLVHIKRHVLVNEYKYICTFKWAHSTCNFMRMNTVWVVWYTYFRHVIVQHLMSFSPILFQESKEIDEIKQRVWANSSGSEWIWHRLRLIILKPVVTRSCSQIWTESHA